MLKQYIFIPRYMKAGKACSQACHASYLALREFRSFDWFNSIERRWRNTGMCVIVLGVDSVDRLRDVEKYCKDWNIVHHLYNDESEALLPTCLATGIILDKDQWMFNKFKLHGMNSKKVK